MSQAPPEESGQLHTLSILEALRAETRHLWGTSSDLHSKVEALLRQLANPNLHDIPAQLPFRIEIWDRNDQHIRWVVAATSSVAVGHAALDAAIVNFPGQRFTLRNGILVIREHVPSLGKPREMP
jgi:predicted cobalt transporter CbtA